MDIFRVYRLSFAKSLGLHGLILALLFISIQRQSLVATAEPEPEIVQATVLDETKVQAEIDRLRSREEQKRLEEEYRQQQLEQQRIQEESRLAEAKQRRKQQELQALEEERQREAIKAQEAQRLAELRQQQQDEAKRLEAIKKQQEETEKKRQEEEKRRKEAEEQRRAEEKRLADLEKKQEAEAAKMKREAELRKQKERQLALKKEQEAALAKQKQKAIADGESLVKQKVISNWIRPPSAPKGLTAKVLVKLIPGGEVIDARVTESSGNSAFDRSAETAVFKSTPLPVPTDPELFREKFRSFQFKFNPT